jgi:hypothetical protein
LQAIQDKSHLVRPYIEFLPRPNEIRTYLDFPVKYLPLVQNELLVSLGQAGRQAARMVGRRRRCSAHQSPGIALLVMARDHCQERLGINHAHITYC